MERIFHGASREDAKHAKFGEIGKYFSLRCWRLGAKNFVEVVLLNILSVRIYQTSGPLAKRTARKRGGLFGRRNAIVMQPRQAMILAINNAILVMLFAFAAWLCQRSRKMGI